MKILTKAHILSPNSALIEIIIGVAAGDITAKGLVTWMVNHINKKR